MTDKLKPIGKLPNRLWIPTGNVIKYVIPCSGGKVKEMQTWYSTKR